MPRGLYFPKALLEGLIFGGAYLRREICVAKSIWASFIVRGKLTVFALFYFVFKGNFQSQAPWGLIFEGAIQRRVFCVTSLGGGAHIWRGLYREGLIFGILR